MWKDSDYVFCLKEGREHFLIFRSEQFPEQYENVGGTGTVFMKLALEKMVAYRTHPPIQNLQEQSISLFDV